VHTLAQFYYRAFCGHIEGFFQTLDITVAVEVNDDFLKKNTFLVAGSYFGIFLPRVLLMLRMLSGILLLRLKQSCQ
jgi:hypothetical protein